MTSLICDSERRREILRRYDKLHGLDYLEVSAKQRTLTVHFLGKAPHGSHRLTEQNVVIEGGRRIRDIKVSRAVTHPYDPEFDDTLEVVVDRAGDFSTYTLRIVARDSRGRPRPHPSFDPRYDEVNSISKSIVRAILIVPISLSARPRSARNRRSTIWRRTTRAFDN